MVIALATVMGVVVGIVIGAIGMHAVRRRQGDEFRALSAEALAASSEQFLTLAELRFGALEDAAGRESQAREKVVNDLVTPIDTRLGTLQDALVELDRSRTADSARLTELLGQLSVTTNSLQSETKILATAMKDTRARGSWGELQLQRVVELAGMVEHCDFITQTTFEGENGALRPDLVVRLPQSKAVVVDSKVPMQAYLEAVNCHDPAIERGLLEQHAKAVALHVDQLRRRDYSTYVDGALDFVVMFVPGDAFLTAAFEARPSLFDDAIGRGVFLATPGTLIALLRAIAYGWRQEQLTESSAEIARLGQELHQRVAKFAEHLAKVGKSLDGASKSYNDAIASLESRVLVTTRKLADHGVSSAREIPSPTALATVAQPLTAAEFNPEIGPSTQPEPD
jgi:DNA recombination protein RmuC